MTKILVTCVTIYAAEAWQVSNYQIGLLCHILREKISKKCLPRVAELLSAFANKAPYYSMPREVGALALSSLRYSPCRNMVGILLLQPGKCCC
jgi:hypothetical protein